MPEPSEQADQHANREEPIAPPSLYTLPSELVTLLLDATMVIEGIRHRLKGEIQMMRFVKDSEGNDVPYTAYEKIGAEVMNDKGVEMVVSVVSGYINPESTFTTLDDEEIYKITRALDKNLNALFYSKGTEYDMDRNYKTITKDMICDICFCALKKSKDKALMEALTKSWSVRELKGYPPEKRGITDVLLSPFRGGNKQ